MYISDGYHCIPTSNQYIFYSKDNEDVEVKQRKEILEGGFFDTQFIRVDRIIGERDGDENTEYLIKWKTLPYEESTWEDEEDLSTFVKNWPKKVPFVRT